MKIAAIILNYNSAADTRKCIEFFQKQKLNEELHVIVVDNSDREQGVGSWNGEILYFVLLLISKF